jgi:hypothetical protein
MRLRFIAYLWFSLACVACGGASDEGKEAKTAAEDDKGFSEYAATHGIQTLEGGGASPEVTADGLRFEAVGKDAPVKLDGVLSEWPAPAKATVVKGSTRSALKIGLQYDSSRIYVGADVTDPSFVAGKNHVSLVLAVPTPSSTYATYEVDLFAGKPGETEGSVRVARRGAVPGAKIVEATQGGGYTFEASLPWSAVPEARSTKVGIHGVASYVDGDGAVATGPGDAQHPRDMPWVPSEPELSMIEQLLQPRGLTNRSPDVELVADLTGDGNRERVAVWQQFLTVCGTSYLGGTGFFYRDLGGQLVKLDVRDVTGRGKGDLVVRRKQSVGDGSREYLEVLSIMSASEEPKLTFAHEIAIRQSDKHVDNSVHLGRGAIEVSIEPATNWDVSSYSEPIASDVEPLLLPWDTVRSQVFKFEGGKFTKTKEVSQPGHAGQASQATASGPTASDQAPSRPPEPQTPKVVRGGDLSGQLLEQFRKDRNVPAGLAPKVDLQVHVAGDARPERVILLGRDVVVFGPGFKGGTAYTFLTLQQFADPGDIKDLSARDLTGDGAADLIVRGVRHVTSDNGPVETEVMFVYQVGNDSITRVFGVETAREQGGKRAQGLVQFVPAAGGKSFDILAAPGRATGWTEKTYPWAQDQPGHGSVEPLLLPWGGVGSVRYSWNGTQFASH